MSLPQQQSVQAIRAAFLDFVGDPFYGAELESVRYVPDGLLIVKAGTIADFGSYENLHEKYTGVAIADYSGKLIMPGLIDTHVHYPQYEMIAAYGEQLLEWLNKYTFPTEGKFKNKEYAQKIASLFLDELLKNGTTTALVFATVHPESVDAFFEEACRRNLRMISGKVLMDRHAPDFLTDTLETAYEDSKRLIQKWHKNGRSLYAVTPRFAATSTEEQLRLAGKLLKEFPDVYLHTHLSENMREVEWIAELFSDAEGYLDVYDRAGLVTDRSVFAHGIHLTDSEFGRLSAAKSAISFCPTSNLFLGSGLFKLHKAKAIDRPVKVGLGTDVGAGTSFSLLHTASEAYKVVQLQQESLSAFKALFLATLGGAKALSLEDKLGNFEVGKEADFIVLNLHATPLMAVRNHSFPTDSILELADAVFGLIILGDDRAVHAVYVAGELAHSLASV
ncbi:MAG TPA: guanine deaminase [Thermosynechococcaceae cyanobacterium]